MPEPRLKEIAEEMGLKIGYMNSNGHCWGWFSEGRKEIRLGTTDDRVFFHELAHAIDHKFNADKWVNGQDAVQEITAELSAAVLGMMALCGLPMPYHPVFNVPRFALATRNRFFLCIESADAKFDVAATRRFLESLGPREVTDVEP